MAVERTLSIIKPDATRRNLTGKINAKFEAAGLRFVAQKRVQLTRAQAEGFYAVHRERPFFGELCDYMTSGPVLLAALRRKDAVAHWRKVIGATDPRKADEGTLRKQFGVDLTSNAVHGSDSAENGLRETAYFFPGAELGR